MHTQLCSEMSKRFVSEKKSSTQYPEIVFALRIFDILFEKVKFAIFNQLHIVRLETQSEKYMALKVEIFTVPLNTIKKLKTFSREQHIAST